MTFALLFATLILLLAGPALFVALVVMMMRREHLEAHDE